MPKPDVKVSIWIACSSEEIWNYLCDVSNEVLWRYGVYLAQWISEPPYVLHSGFDSLPLVLSIMSPKARKIQLILRDHSRAQVIC